PADGPRAAAAAGAGPDAQSVDRPAAGAGLGARAAAGARAGLAGGRHRRRPGRGRAVRPGRAGPAGAGAGRNAVRRAGGGQSAAAGARAAKVRPAAIAVIKYIGSKRALLGHLTGSVRRLLPEGGRVVDLFSGSARVGHALKGEGYEVHANDINAYAHALATAYV